jgi:type VI secretion system Hcp family effector
MAFEGYCVWEGAKSGKNKGCSPRKAHKDKVPFIAFEYGVISPRDVATGQSSGKRQHNPCKITMEWNANTPLIFQSLVMNEQIKSMKFEFVRTDQKTGQEVVYMTCTLTDATFSEASFATGGGVGGASGSKHNAKHDTMEILSLGITFDKIVWEHLIDKTIGEDSWTESHMG